MDRESIERRDFPTGRRGYDPAAVDEHLRRVADEFEARVHSAPPPLSAGTSEQVRQILEAAERGASELRAEASGHVARVREAADGMLGKLDRLETELERLLAALRSSGENLTSGLAELQAQTGALGTEPAAPTNGTPTDDAGARLAALNLALDGASREETAAYLVAHFGLADPAPLLDDVYARLEP
ncbi:MAG TPA: DivIVA domain-containing protein [Solirubrobacter sp.]|nr:DivIVA domain-containing protein [Solirubrobacter sp.]